VSADKPKHSEPAISVAIVDDEPVVRTGLEGLLKRSPGFVCGGVYADAESAMSGLPTRQPNVLLMDIQLPGLDGISAIRTLRGRLPKTEIIMLTALEDHDRIFASFAAGAAGYLLKHTAPNKILEAIREVFAGGSPMSAPIARRLVKFFDSDKVTPHPATHLQVPSVEANASLTAREQEVLNLMAEGLLYKEAADRLGLSVDTIRAHLRNIYKKLRVRNRTEAILKVADAKAG
jgi:DNA-binding NarL/FixJ family response regulator